MSASDNERDAIREIAGVFARIDDPDAMRRFFDEIFTPAERRDLALRWRLLRRLHAGMPQRRIAEELGISLCKITRGSRVLKRTGSISFRLLNDTGDIDHANDGPGN